jgi:hypothetical protein
MGKTKTARLWTYVRDDRPAGSDVPPAVWFVYSPDRKGEHPRQHLKDFFGVLQADAYAGFGHLYQAGRIQEAACMAHVRRMFYDIQVASGSPIAAEAIQRIGSLYDIEREIRGKQIELRHQVRQTRARPLVDELHVWMNKTLAKISRKSDTAGAIRYALSRWCALTRYLEDGRIEVDNSAAERALRAVALGRKNFLFAGLMLAPSSQTIPCFAQRAEPLDIQTFVSQAPVEAFGESVLHRSAGPYETKLHTVPDGPDLESAAGKLASVIQGDAFRCCTAFFDGSRQSCAHMRSVHRSIRFQRYTLSSELVDNRQDAIGAPVRQLVADEIG